MVQAENGLEGIDLASQVEPSMIILDIQLPFMYGYEVARRLKSKKETQDIPIVAVTSYAMVGDREKVLAAGCTGYIEKPINPDTFIAEIEKFFSLDNVSILASVPMIWKSSVICRIICRSSKIPPSLHSGPNDAR